MAAEKKKKGSELDELSLDEMLEKKKQIDELLANIENQYRNAEITEQSYKQTKESNLRKLADVKKRLAEWGILDTDAAKPPAAEAKTSAPSAPSITPAAAQKTSPSVPSVDAVQKTGSEPAQERSPTKVPEKIPIAPTIENLEPSPEQNSPAPALSFAQKLKQQFIQPRSSPARQAEDTGTQPVSQIQTIVTQTAELAVQKFQEKFNVELERIKTELEGVKESKTATEERMRMISDSITELRSTVFQREAGIRDHEMKLTKIKEMVDEIEPQKITKEFIKRDKTYSDVELRTEKLEIKANDILKNVGEINALLKSIGGLENIANMDHEISKKVERVREINAGIDRLASKTEKIFIEMNKRLEKFNIYEARQDNMSEILNDMIKNFDGLNIKFESYVEKKDMTTLKEDMADMQKKLEELKKTLKKAVPFAEVQIPEELMSLQAEREDIESLLSSVEYEHEKKQIADGEYRSIREKNEARLKDIKEKIRGAIKNLAAEEEKQEASKAKKKLEEKPETKEAAAEKTPVTATDAKKPAEPKEKQDAPNEKPAAQIVAAVPKEKSVATAQATAAKPAISEANATTAPAANTPTAATKEIAKNNTATGKISEAAQGKVPANATKPAAEQKTPRRSIRTPLGSLAESPKAEEMHKAAAAVSAPKENIPETKKEPVKNDIELNPLLAEIEQSFKEGLITKETYENTKKLLMMG